jgi:hypothetical protein
MTLASTPVSANTVCAVNEAGCVCLDYGNCPGSAGASKCYISAGTDRNNMQGVLCGANVPCLDPVQSCGLAATNLQPQATGSGPTHS